MSAAAAAKVDVPNANPPTKVKLTHENRVETLKSQLEFYFSQHNVSRDVFLKSKMDEQGYVAIRVIANFNRVKELVDSDVEFLTNVMRRCKHLTVHEDGTKVRAVSKLRRTTLILRDIPRDVPEDEVKEIFNFPECGPIASYKPEVGDTWFVTFENEKDCENASIALLSRTFKGKPIRCRIKSETQRVRYASRAASIPYWTPYNANGARGFNINAASFTPTFNPQAAPYNGNAAPYNSNSNYQYGVMQTGMYYGNYGKNVNPGYGWQPPYNKSQQQDGRRGRKSDGQYNNQNSKGRQYGYKKGRKNNNRKKKPREPVIKQVAPVAADFPALEGASVVAIPNTLTRSAAQVAAAATSKPREDTAARSSAVANPVTSTGNTAKATRIIYNKKEMSAVIAGCIKKGQEQKPPKIPANSGVARRQPLQSILINEPFPIIYPASPSPELAAQSVRSSDVVPFLALDDYMPSVDNPQTVRQEDIAAVVGKVQGIEVQPRPADTNNTRSHRAKSGAWSTESENGKEGNNRAKKSQKGKTSPAVVEGKDTDGFTTVKGNRKDRRKRGGHGGRDGRGGSYGHGHGYGHGQGKQGSRRSDRRDQRGKYAQDKAHGKAASKAPRKPPKASKPVPAKKVTPVTSNGKLSFAAMLKKKPASQKPVSQAKAPRNDQEKVNTKSASK